MKKIAIFPGSFDPVTIGHIDIINRASNIFDEVIVAIGVNSKKKNLFPLNRRIDWLNEIFKSNDKVSASHYTGLTVDYCKKIHAKFIIRGIRTTMDYEYEKTIAQLNSALYPGVETVLLYCQPQYAHISSTIVREIIINKGDVSQFVPKEVVV